MNLTKLADSLQSDLELIESIQEVILEHQVECSEDEIIEFWNGDGGWGQSHHDGAIIKAMEKSGEDEICWGCNTTTKDELNDRGWAL